MTKQTATNFMERPTQGRASGFVRRLFAAYMRSRKLRRIKASLNPADDWSDWSDDDLLTGVHFEPMPPDEDWERETA